MSKRGNISVGEGINVAFTALRANKMRSTLTMLGIIIGVAAMITMVAMGSGARRAVEQRIQALGAGLLFVRPGAPHQGFIRLSAGSVETLDDKDVEAIRTECPSVVAVIPEATGFAQVKFENKNWNTRVTGSIPDYEWVRNAATSQGGYFTNAENQRRERVCVIGQEVATNLFEDTDPVGKTIRINGMSFEVKGVLKEKGIQGWMNQDDMILIPIETALNRLFGRDTFGSLTLKVRDESLIERAILEVETTLRRMHRLAPGQENDFNIRSMSDVGAAQAETANTFTMLLASIALVSLIVGGIGIMNIMLVSVTERTREIGVRKAMGARRRDILLQFLMESITLSVIGGTVGIGVGVGAAMVLSRFYGWNTLIVPEAVFVSFAFAALVGIFFGLYPARKAARLDPIEALRYE
ncbi:MAG TPA: ABC transporter permease [bacterium]|nr:ABC transporter permease [bacterium]